MTPLPLPLPLSRRDRAACVLAYECIRRGYSVQCSWTNEQRSGNCEAQLFDARAALTAGHSMFTHDLRAQLGCVFRQPIDPPPRVLRARLALLLRAVLRADAGDCGPSRMRCTACGWSERAEEDATTSAEERARWQACEAQPAILFEPLRAPWEHDRRVTPLWEQCPRSAP